MLLVYQLAISFYHRSSCNTFSKRLANFTSNCYQIRGGMETGNGNKFSRSTAVKMKYTTDGLTGGVWTPVQAVWVLHWPGAVLK